VHLHAPPIKGYSRIVGSLEEVAEDDGGGVDETVKATICLEAEKEPGKKEEGQDEEEVDAGEVDIGLQGMHVFARLEAIGVFKIPYLLALLIGRWLGWMGVSTY
jgi:hypothetical protein